LPRVPGRLPDRALNQGVECGAEARPINSIAI
jgi:hypothetical protein